MPSKNRVNNSRAPINRSTRAMNAKHFRDNLSGQKYGRFSKATPEHYSIPNTAAGVPNSPEAVEYLMRHRVPGGAMANNTPLLIDEQRYLDRAELEEKVEDCLVKMTPAQLNYAQLILQGRTAKEAAFEALCSDAEKEQLSKSAVSTVTQKLKTKRVQMNREHPHVAEYISASIRLAHLQTLDTVAFNDAEWLQLQRQLIGMSMGIIDTPKVFLQDGTPVSFKVKDAALGVAQRALESVARHYGWLSDKVEVTQGAVVNIKDFTGFALAQTQDDGSTVETPVDGEIIVDVQPADSDEEIWL